MYIKDNSKKCSRHIVIIIIDVLLQHNLIGKCKSFFCCCSNLIKFFVWTNSITKWKPTFSVVCNIYGWLAETSATPLVMLNFDSIKCAICPRTKKTKPLQPYNNSNTLVKKSETVTFWFNSWCGYSLFCIWTSIYGS